MCKKKVGFLKTFFVWCQSCTTILAIIAIYYCHHRHRRRRRLMIVLCWRALSRLGSCFRAWWIKCCNDKHRRWSKHLRASADVCRIMKQMIAKHLFRVCVTRWKAPSLRLQTQSTIACWMCRTKKLNRTTTTTLRMMTNEAIPLFQFHRDLVTNICLLSLSLSLFWFNIALPCFFINKQT